MLLTSQVSLRLFSFPTVEHFINHEFLLFSSLLQKEFMK